ncbi:MAG: MaoC family dehydratase [Pseudomonadota bacterium]|nr:MaoC family dehydratase [Pseudomonadota bacterium]MDP1902784.1 MaoC family dehydratase [Pseudomonadota bacterium]MDP2351018.1 MaoC family dehydratase [Pseudomonadota bacterium]
MNGNFFENFELGQNFLHATPRTVGEGEIALYLALTGSRHLLGASGLVAHALGYPKRPLDDLLAFHLAFGKTVADISLNAVANLGYADVRFLAPVYVGDTLVAESTVIGRKENRDGAAGIIWVRSTAINQNDREVLTWVRWVMVKKRDKAAPAPTPVIPETPPCVTPSRLVVPEFLDTRQFETSLTGGERLWDDYQPGERIAHPAGMTLEEADHTFATRLYQNPARLHFDAHLMRDTPFGRRLVYGGHVISVCRALSYDGLENALLIAAINAGSHANPTFAGDTLYCRHEVLEKWQLPGRDDLGALRLRMIGLKNLPAGELAETKVEGKYHPNVVLDLDYTVLMPM